MKKLLVFLVIIGIVTGGYYAFRLFPLLVIDNTGNDKVVLLHGLGRSEMAMLRMESELTEAGFDVYSIGYPSTEETPDTLVQIVSEEINACCADGPETVHFVGHSLGGLLIRAYLGEHRLDHLGRVVLLGSPNKGSELANPEVRESVPNSLLEMAGPTASALRTGPTGFPASLPAPYYPVGVIAGTRDTAMANKWLPVPNDGLVSVESAQLDGMTDFLTLDVTHWDLRSNPIVGREVVEFLSNGRFEHAER